MSSLIIVLAIIGDLGEQAAQMGRSRYCTAGGFKYFAQLACLPQSSQAERLLHRCRAQAPSPDSANEAGRRKLRPLSAKLQSTANHVEN
jgi:hypothetical protein